jgi:hypothetical protein
MCQFAAVLLPVALLLGRILFMSEDFYKAAPDCDR